MNSAAEKEGARQRVGFVGLGLMGFEMVKNLLADGFQVVGYDIDPVKVDAVGQIGATGIQHPNRLAPQVDVIMLSLPNSQVVNQVVKDDLGLIKKGRKEMKISKAKMFNKEASDPKNKPDQILKAIALQPGKCIVDIGAGGGYFSL